MGLKLGAEVAGVGISSAVSLGVIISTLGSGVALSLLADADEKDGHQPKSPALSRFVDLVYELKQAATRLKNRVR